MVDTSGGTKNKSRAQAAREKILAQLDAADKEVPQNPGLFNLSGKEGESFSDMFEKSLSERDNKVGDIVKGRVVEVQEGLRSRGY